MIIPNETIDIFRNFATQKKLIHPWSTVLKNHKPNGHKKIIVCNCLTKNTLPHAKS